MTAIKDGPIKSLTLVTLFISMLGSFTTIAAENSAVENHSIYVVRHAEKQADMEDPSLTACGKYRAKQLANLLSQAKVTKIYSTSYRRTRETAAPLAQQQQIAVQNYNPRHLEQLALQLQQRQENVLVVGHSNTTPQLVSLLTKQKITPLTESDYQQLYQVQFVNQQVVLTLLTQPLICK